MGSRSTDAITNINRRLALPGIWHWPGSIYPSLKGPLPLISPVIRIMVHDTDWGGFFVLSGLGLRR